MLFRAIFRTQKIYNFAGSKANNKMDDHHQPNSRCARPRNLSKFNGRCYKTNLTRTSKVSR